MRVLKRATDPCIVLMLAAEDDCLGIDFNPTTSAINQVLVPSTLTLCESFEAALLSLDQKERRAVQEDPGNLAWLYTRPFSQTFACHLELYRRQWGVLYEPYANTSAVYGDVESRNRVRQHAKDFSRHLQYINRSLDNMRRLNPHETNTRDQQMVGYGTSELKKLVVDFERFAAELGILKAACDLFLEQQVSKISLYEARISMREAKDLKHLSYLGFVFVPLSLSSSFFSVQIRPLGGQAPLWTFIVTSLTILAISLLILLLSTSDTAQSWVKWVRDLWLGSLSWSRERFRRGSADKNSEGYGLPLVQPQRPPTSQIEQKTPSVTVSGNGHPETSLFRQSLIPPGQSQDSTPNPHIVMPDIPETAVSSVTHSTKRGVSLPVAPPTVRSSRLRSRKSTRPIIPKNDKERDLELSRVLEISTMEKPVLREEYADPPRAPKPDHTSGQTSTHIPGPAPRGTVDTTARSGRNSVDKMTIPAPKDEENISAGQADTVNGSTGAAGPGATNGTVSVEHSDAKHGRTPLHQAAHRGDTNIVQGLLNEGADLEKRDAEQMTPLHLAAKEGHAAIVELLLTAGALPLYGHHDNNSHNTLAAAVSKGHDSVLRTLIDWPGPDVNVDIKKQRKVYTEEVKRAMFGDALQRACQGDVAAVRQLIQAVRSHGGKFDNELKDALCSAAPGDLVGIVSILAKAIQDPEVRSNAVDTALRSVARSAGTPDAAMRELLEEGAKVTPETFAGLRWGLWSMCRDASEGTVRLLFQQGADPNLKETSSGTPLSFVAERGSLDLVKLLVDAGADVNAKYVVRNAAKSGNVEVMKALMDAGANIHVEETVGYSFGLGGPGDPLECAAEQGHEDMVRLLLDSGVNLDYVYPHHNEGTTRGEDALASACHRHEAIAHMLLDRGVNILYTDTRWYSGAFGGPKPTAPVTMIGAARRGFLRLMKRALDAGGSPNSTDFAFRSLLNIAAESGQQEAAVMLLDHGADIQYGGDPANIPLHTAILNGHVDFAKMLLDRGADIGEAALHVAAMTDSSPAILFLLEHGVEIEGRDVKGQTSLHVAAREGYSGVVETLLDKGAFVDARDKEGWTPVHRAAWNGHKDVVELLSQRGADMDLETDEGLTVLDFLEDQEETDLTDSSDSLKSLR